MELHFKEAKIGAIVFLANLITAFLIAIMAGVFALVGIGVGVLSAIQGTSFDVSQITAITAIWIIGLVIVLLYLSFVVRGIVFSKVIGFFKVKI